MLNKILVAIDYADISKPVFESAISMAQNTNASLMLLHVLAEDEPGFPVIPSYTYYPVLDDYDYNLYRKKLEDYKQKGLAFLQTKAKEAKAAGVKAEFVQLNGNPGRAICELANTWSADLIIVGSRGLRGLKEIFLGSVSNYVTHHAPCSVFILRTAIDSELDPASTESETNEEHQPLSKQKS